MLDGLIFGFLIKFWLLYLFFKRSKSIDFSIDGLDVCIFGWLYLFRLGLILFRFMELLSD